MKNKSKLHGKEQYKRTYVNEDLSNLRASMFRMAKECESVKSVSTRDGKIIARMRENDERVAIDSPDDLWKLGISEPDWKRLGMEQYQIGDF